MPNVTHCNYCNSLIILNNSRWIADEDAVKWSNLGGKNKKKFISKRLTCVSYMEQNGAGREAEVGNVGAEFKPLQTRGRIKDNVIWILCESCKQKGWQIVYHQAHNARIHRNNNYYSALQMAGKRIHCSFCDFKLKKIIKTNIIFMQYWSLIHCHCVRRLPTEELFWEEKNRPLCLQL